MKKQEAIAIRAENERLRAEVDRLLRLLEPLKGESASVVLKELETQRRLKLDAIAERDDYKANGPCCGKCADESSVTDYSPDNGWRSWCKKCQLWTSHGE